MNDTENSIREGGAEIASALRRLIVTNSDHPEDAARLFRYATRHLPVEGAEAGSSFVPPVYGWRIARALGLNRSTAARLSAASCLYFAAADVLDDVADGDRRWNTGQDVNDGCRLLFLHQRALGQLEVDLEIQAGLVRLYADQGLVMATGQGWDLAGTNALVARAPLEIAAHKSGAEFSACMAAPALVAGRDPAPWIAFGAAFGALAQTLSDYFDLFLDPESDDWIAGKPTLPIRAGLDAAAHRAPLLALLAGARGRPERKAVGLWRLAQAGAAGGLSNARQILGARMATAAQGAGSPACLGEFPVELDEWIDGVVDALTEFATDPEPPGTSLAVELRQARSAADRWRKADPSLAETARAHRVGPFAGDDVAEDVFGRCLAHLLGPGLGGRAHAERAILKRARGGWSELSGTDGLPASADVTGLVLQLMSEKRRGHRAVRAAATLVQAHLGAEGCPPRWLVRPEWADPWGLGEHLAADGVEPVAAANALYGLWAVGWRSPEIVTGLVALLEGLATGLESTVYGPAAVDFFVARAGRAVGAEHAPVKAALERVGPTLCARWAERQRLDGHFGTALETAMVAAALAPFGGPSNPAAVARALVDSQAPDGGYPADPLRRAVPRGAPAWYASRIVTSVLIEHALTQLEAAHPDAIADQLRAR